MSVLRRFFLPSIADWVFVAVLAVILLPPGAASGLLADGDIGWHIRTGDYILAHGQAPGRDLFSFSRPDGEWFAWEWLAGVIFALVDRGFGLHGVALLAGLLIASAAAVLFRRLQWEGAGMVGALALTLVAVAASAVHHLARPHLFTYLLLPVAMWMVERDRRAPSRRVWWLVPMATLWANLHAGFVALLALLALEAAGAAVSATLRPQAKRLALLFALCSAATLVNPYGGALHAHIVAYLNSDWIRNAVEEFQAPRFRDQSSMAFLVLLFAGLMAATEALRRREYGLVANLLFWAQAALHSARHIPVYALFAAPAVAMAWGASMRRLAGEPDERTPDRPAWGAALAGAAVVLALTAPAHFPDARFPITAVSRHAGQIRDRRVLTSDQWADYLLYRFPGQKVFLDGRTDFYGRQVAHEYSSLMLLEGGWREALERGRFEAALLPNEWPLAAVLAREPGWRRVYADSQASLFERAR
jgi:hypothetical protein